MIFVPAEAVRNIRTAVVVTKLNSEGSKGYQNCIEGIFARRSRKHSDISDVRMLLDILGKPDENLPVIHITGTNGKGSTASYINQILMQAGYRVGLFTSPGIQSVNDRFRVNNRKIEDEALIELAHRVKQQAAPLGEFGEFQLMTCMAFLYFQEQGCDILVLEAGIGGRLDSTNVLRKKTLAVITSVGLDHTEILGDTLEKIAFEKAGIIPSAGTVICGNLPEEARAVIEAQANLLQSQVCYINTGALEESGRTLEGQCFRYLSYSELSISLLGIHQLENAAIAVEASLALQKQGFSLTEKEIRAGLAAAVWEGRFEILSKEPLVILDGAHNPEGARMLRKNLDRYFPDRQRIYIIGMMRHKDHVGVLEPLLTNSKVCLAVPVSDPGGADPETIRNMMKEYCQNSRYNGTIERSIAEAVELADADSLICICGSLYLVNEAREYFKAGETVDKAKR